MTQTDDQPGGPTVLTTENQTADELHTTAVAADPNMLTTERHPDAPADVDVDVAGCKLPGCEQDATMRGLCDAHWFTHRGLADPEQQAPEQDGEVAKP